MLTWILEGNVVELSRYCQNPDLKMTKKHNTKLSLLFRSCIRIAESRDKMEELKRI